MILHCSNLKPLFKPTWLEYRQVEEEHNQVAKQVPKGSTSISGSKVTYHHIFQGFKKFRDDLNIVTNKKLT